MPAWDDSGEQEGHVLPDDVGSHPAGVLGSGDELVEAVADHGQLPVEVQGAGAAEGLVDAAAGGAELDECG